MSQWGSKVSSDKERCQNTYPLINYVVVSQPVTCKKKIKIKIEDKFTGKQNGWIEFIINEPE